MLKYKWDWLVILCEETHPRYINGKEIPNWQQGPTLWEAVSHLGLKGWLLISFDSFTLAHGHGKLTLVRPKQ